MIFKKKYFILLILLILMIISLLGYVKYEQIVINSDDSALEGLRSLPYAAYSKSKIDQTKKGVVSHDKEKAGKGYNLYNAILMGMGGKKIHQWPNLNIDLAVVLGNGDILAFNYKEKSLGKVKVLGRYDWQGKLIWEKDIFAHHEIYLSGDTMLVLAEEMHVYKGRKVEFDVIIEYSKDGEELSRWSTWDNLKYLRKHHGRSRLEFPEKRLLSVTKTRKERREKGAFYPGDYDYYHANSIQVLPQTLLGKKNKHFRKGNWLVCMRNTDLVFIIDRKTKKIVWSYGPGTLDGPHMPRMLENGNILIYDNGTHRGYTRVIEINPVNKKIVWEYKANPPENFFSRSRGSAQRLSNGNTLIADADNGRAFEVTKVGEIVWEWYNPMINDNNERYSFYRMVRYPRKYIEDILKLKQPDN